MHRYFVRSSPDMAVQAVDSLLTPQPISSWLILLWYIWTPFEKGVPLGSAENPRWP